MRVFLPVLSVFLLAGCCCSPDYPILIESPEIERQRRIISLQEHLLQQQIYLMEKQIEREITLKQYPSPK
jgi:hypothetical protein